MKLRILASALAVAGVLAVASPASAQVVVSPGYTPYSGTVVTPGTTAYGVPGLGSVTVGSYSPYTAGSYYMSPYTAGNYYSSPYTSGYYSPYSGYSGYSTYSGYSPYAASGYGYPAYSNSSYYYGGGGYGRRGYRRW